MYVILPIGVLGFISRSREKRRATSASAVDPRTTTTTLHLCTQPHGTGSVGGRRSNSHTPTNTHSHTPGPFLSFFLSFSWACVELLSWLPEGLFTSQNRHFWLISKLSGMQEKYLACHLILAYSWLFSGLSGLKKFFIRLAT